jgi:hypothetical protein
MGNGGEKPAKVEGFLLRRRKISVKNCRNAGIVVQTETI